jgi:electron transfer flavoprotein alpha subunit
MKRLLVLLDTDGEHVLPSSTAAIEFARQLGSPFDILIAGAPSIAEEASAWTGYGAARVLLAASDDLAHPTADRLAAVCVHLMDSTTSIVGTTGAADILARVAGVLDLPAVNNVSTIEQEEKGPAFRRLALDDRIMETVRVDAPRVAFTARATQHSTPPLFGTGESTSQIVTVTVDPSYLPQGTTWISRTASVHKRPPMHEARVIVAGGRSLGDSATFEQYLGKVADKLGGAVAASGGAVHSGIAPSTQLVGQTGQTVEPELYIAVGISGADQHIGGMQNSRVIVAINRDPHAAIFRVADYGLVADYREALPELAEKL